MIELSAHVVFVLSLVEKFLILFIGIGDDLERELLVVAEAFDVIDRAVGAFAEFAEDLEFADGFRHTLLLAKNPHAEREDYTG